MVMKGRIPVATRNPQTGLYLLCFATKWCPYGRKFVTKWRRARWRRKMEASDWLNTNLVCILFSRSPTAPLEGYPDHCESTQCRGRENVQLQQLQWRQKGQLQRPRDALSVSRDASKMPAPDRRPNQFSSFLRLYGRLALHSRQRHEIKTIGWIEATELPVHTPTA